MVVANSGVPAGLQRTRATATWQHGARDGTWRGARGAGRENEPLKHRRKWPGDPGTDKDVQVGEDTKLSNLQVWGTAALNRRTGHAGNGAQAGRALPSASPGQNRAFPQEYPVRDCKQGTSHRSCSRMYTIYSDDI